MEALLNNTPYSIRSTKVKGQGKWEDVEMVVMGRLGQSMEQIILGHANWAHGLDS
jgi:hypothetical protein